MVALLLTHLALLILIAGLRFADDLDLVLGFTLSVPRWAMLSGVLLSLAGLAIRREVAEDRAPWSETERAAIWVLLVGVPVLHWVLGDAEAYLGVDFVLLLIAGTLGWTVVLRRPEVRSGHFWWGGRWSWWLALAGMTAAVMGGLLAFGERAPAAGALPWLTYPLYALLQLGLLLELPERIWRTDGYRRAERVVALSILFAMVHGPNPVVLVLAALGMVAWATARTAGVGLLPLAVSMGLLGATAAQVLPEVETQNMRVGPGFVIKRVRDRDLERYERTMNELASDAAFQRGGGTLAGWLDLVHSEVFARPLDPATRKAWLAKIIACHRAHMVRITLESEEYRQRHGIERLMTGQDRSLLYSSLRPWHPAQAPYTALCERAERRALEEDHESFLLHVYRSLQGRTPASDELAAWDGHPDRRGREEIVRRFLLEAGIEDPATWRHPEREIEWPGPATEAPSSPIR